MRRLHIGVSLILTLFCICSEASAQEQNISVTGQLVRVAAVGGESTGWAIQMRSETAIGGKQVHSVEIRFRETEQLDALENKSVKATGQLSHQRGVETGYREILEVSSIKEVKQSASTSAFSLTGSEWLLEDLGGSGVVDRGTATLTFPEAGKVAGKGSCNRFFGPAVIQGEVIKIGPLGATRMACPEAAMNQETKYLNALQAARRFERKGLYLLLYCKGFEKPLRFTKTGSAPSAPAH